MVAENLFENLRKDMECIMEDRNSTSKMTPEQLEKWLALRKKCHVHKSKKDYTRKEKHKKNYAE